MPLDRMERGRETAVNKVAKLLVPESLAPLAKVQPRLVNLGSSQFQTFLSNKPSRQKGFNLFTRSNRFNSLKRVKFTLGPKRIPLYRTYPAGPRLRKSRKSRKFRKSILPTSTLSEERLLLMFH